MKTVTVKQLSRDWDHLLHEAATEDLVLQLEDGREFLATAIDDFDREIIATRRNEKLMAFLDACAREKATIPHEEIERELGLTDPAESIETQGN
jgi:hypothetical protein